MIGHLEHGHLVVVGLMDRLEQTLFQAEAVAHQQRSPHHRLDVAGRGTEVVRVLSVGDDDLDNRRVADELLHDIAEDRVGDDDDRLAVDGGHRCRAFVVAARGGEEGAGADEHSTGEPTDGVVFHSQPLPDNENLSQ